MMNRLGRKGVLVGLLLSVSAPASSQVPLDITNRTTVGGKAQGLCTFIFEFAYPTEEIASDFAFAAKTTKGVRIGGRLKSPIRKVGGKFNATVTFFEPCSELKGPFTAINPKVRVLTPAERARKDSETRKPFPAKDPTAGGRHIESNRVSANLDIPSSNPSGVTSRLTLEKQPGIISGGQICVSVTHDVGAQLDISVTHLGLTIPLMNRSKRPATSANLDECFNIGGFAIMTGVWALKVANHGQLGRARLNEWTIGTFK